MSFRTDAVSSAVIELLIRTRPILKDIPQTYLAGGTALSLYLGHRISVDLDFFTAESFLADALTKQLADLGPFVPLNARDNSFVCRVGEVQFSLFRYPYPLLDSLNFYSDVAVASLRDIAAMKIVAISQRGSRKDFYDLYAILDRASHNINSVIQDASTKYQLPQDSSYHFIRSLAFFEDARKEPEIQTHVKMDVDWQGIETFFSELVRKLIP